MDLNLFFEMTCITAVRLRKIPAPDKKHVRLIVVLKKFFEKKRLISNKSPFLQFYKVRGPSFMCEALQITRPDYILCPTLNGSVYTGYNKRAHRLQNFVKKLLS